MIGLIDPRSLSQYAMLNANVVLVNLFLCLKTKVQFVFELSLASAADKKLSAKKPKCIFFLKISRELQKIFFQTYGTNPQLNP